MKNIRVFVSENFQFLEVNFSIYLNRRVFVMDVRDVVVFSLSYMTQSNRVCNFLWFVYNVFPDNSYFGIFAIAEVVDKSLCEGRKTSSRTSI